MEKNPALFDPSQFVRITNKSDAVVEGRYDGKDYEFRIGEPVDVTIQAAHHIFGFAGTDQAKVTAFLRLGWMQVNTDIRVAKKRLEKIEFTEVPNLIEFDARRTARGGPLAEGGTEGAASGSAIRLAAPRDPLADDDDDSEAVLS